MNKPLVVNFHEHPSSYAIKNCEEMNIDKAVLLPVGEDSIQIARQMAAKEPERFIAFHWIDVNNPIEKEVKELKEAVSRWNAKGIKFQPMDQHIYPNDRRLYPIYELCQELGLVITWHAGVVNLGFKYELGVPMLSKYCDPIGFDEVAFDFPQLKICIAHLGGNYLYNALVLAEKHENIHLDTAFLGFFGPRFFPPARPSAIITHAVKVAGPDKILYGSEGVHTEEILNADLSDDEKAKILGLNALRLLNID